MGKVDISPSSVGLYAALAACMAFIAGRATSIYFGIPNLAAEVINPDEIITGKYTPRAHEGRKELEKAAFFPFPRLSKGKKIPKSKYSSMVYNHGRRTVTKHKSLHLVPHAEKDTDGRNNIEEGCNDSLEKETCIVTMEGHAKCTLDLSRSECAAEEEEKDQVHIDDEEEHFPVGQHLLVDIERVNAEFLNSEVKLAEAMVDLVNKAEFTLLSYHCHKLVPVGVSCVGVLLESHVSFHTWPEYGVITLDLFTCGSKKLVPVLPIVLRLFAIPRDGARGLRHEQPHTVWTHKVRGFGDVSESLKKDLGEMLELANYDLKEEIVSVQTSFQKVDIYDLIESSEGIDDYAHYKMSLLNDTSYESKEAHLFLPERAVYLDGVLQSTRRGNEAYHEALVHPAMLSHPSPKRVAIIGGGEGSTLREVLKHATVDKVKMIEIDELMVEVSKNHLPDWNTCADLVGSAAWCGDDTRVDLHYVDAFGWFNDRFSDGVEERDEEPFDVLIMDALDPEDNVPFAKMLYNNRTFVQTLYNSLSDNGVIVLQLGSSPEFRSPAQSNNAGRKREYMIELMEDVGFEAMHIYEEGNCHFDSPWTFLVAEKDKEVDEHWYSSRPEVDVAIHNRIVRTISGEPALKYFDGSVMRGYQYPHKVFETAYCRKVPTPTSCITDQARRNHIPLSALEVRMSGTGDRSGRGVFTTVDIQAGSTIGKKIVGRMVHIPVAPLALIKKYMIDFKSFSDVMTYVDGYGWQTQTFGGEEYFVESSILTFFNHGCNGTYNTIGWSSEEYPSYATEQNATLSDFEDFFYTPFYDMFLARHVMQNEMEYIVSKSYIRAGEEMLSNYLSLVSDEDDWVLYIEELQKICNGQEVGDITRAEEEEGHPIPDAG